MATSQGGLRIMAGAGAKKDSATEVAVVPGGDVKEAVAASAEVDPAAPAMILRPPWLVAIAAVVAWVVRDACRTGSAGVGASSLCAAWQRAGVGESCSS